MSRWSNHLPLDGVPFRDLMSERLGLPVVVDNDAQLRAARRGARRRGRGRVATRVMLTLGTGIGGGLAAGRRGLPRRDGGGRRARPHGGRHATGRRARATARTGAASRRSRPGTALGREGRCAAARAAGHGARAARWRTGSEITGRARHRAGARRRPGRARRARARSAGALGVGLVGLVNVFNPEVIVIGGGVIAAGEMLLEPARDGGARARARRRRATRCAIVAAQFGDEAGMIGRGAAGAGARTRELSAGRLVVCPTPIGNLEDVTLRVLAALREADVVACEDTRRTRVLLDRYGVEAKLVSYHEHNERGARRGAGRADARRRGGRAGRPTPACRWCPTRATCWCGLRGRGAARSRCCPGRRRRSPRWWRRALPADGGASRASCRARGRAARACSAPRRDARGVRVAAAGAGDARRCWPSSTRERAVAVCRELTKAARGGRARHRRRAGGALRRGAAEGEVVLVVGAARRRRPDARTPAALDAAAPAGRAGRHAAQGRRRWWPS